MVARQEPGPRLLILPVRPAYVPVRFYVAQLSDERPAAPNAPLGTLLDETPPRPVAVTLAGGVGTALERFLKTAPTPNRWGVLVRVKKMSFAEKLANPRRIEGQLAVVLAFEVLRNGTCSPLTEFEGGGTFARSVGPVGDLPQNLLRQTLESSLRYLDGWLARNGPGQESLAGRVRVTFPPAPLTPPDRGDTVFYDPSRPLVWDDFRGTPRSGKNYGAAVFTSFGYEASSRTVAGVVEVAMTVRVFTVKAQSWAWPNAKNDYALRHEQLHFDITRLVSGRFKEKLLTETLAPDEYDARIQYLFLEAWREMTRLQEQYDNETSHSINRAEQARWDAKITAELAQTTRQGR